MTRGSVERVLVHLNHLELGGTQINAVDLAAQLRSHGIRSHLVAARETLPSGPSLLEVADARDIEIELYDADPDMMARGRQLSAIADRVGADLVHVYGSWGGGARPTYWGPSRFGRRPWVQTVYEMEVSPKIKRHMPMIVGTGYLIDELQTRPGHTVLIRPPVDTNTDRPDPIAGSAFREAHDLTGLLLVIVSRLDADMKAKPISIAIEAMRRLSADTTLVIVGAGDQQDRLRALGAEVNAEAGRGAVRFVGAMADPRPAYAAADVMLSMGGSAARSLAFGNPLVVQGEAGWSELFERRTAASLARSSYWSPDSVAAPVDLLCEKIRPLLDDPQLRADLGAFGREFAIETFGLDAMARELRDFYDSAATAYGLRHWVRDLPAEGVVLAQKLGRVLLKKPRA